MARWRDPAGVQKKKSFRRKVDAERFLAEVSAQMHRGSYVDPAAGKVPLHVHAKLWEQNLGHLKESSAERYRGVLKTHVLPKWGNWQLAKIGRSDVASWLSELNASGLSAGTVRKTYLVLSMVLEAAVLDGRLARNPARDVKLPRQARREPRFLSARELQSLITAAEGNGLHIAVLGLTGLRFGEFAALRVGSLDVRRNRLVVSASVSVVGSRMVFTTPKTHRTRSVPVPPTLMHALGEEAAGRGAHELLFTSPQGSVLRLNNWRRRIFNPACEVAKLTNLTPHDLRHTAASLAIARGANVKAVQHMLGHASAAMTLDVYAGLFPDDLDAIGASLDSLVPHLRHKLPTLSQDDAAPASTFAEYRGAS